VKHPPPSFPQPTNSRRQCAQSAPRCYFLTAAARVRICDRIVSSVLDVVSSSIDFSVNCHLHQHHPLLPSPLDDLPHAVKLSSLSATSPPPPPHHHTLTPSSHTPASPKGYFLIY
jgi:hypothetical protein